jgi:ribonuclease III
MADWPVIFRTWSDIEASVVVGLLQAHGIQAVRSSSGVTHQVFPLNVEGATEVRLSVPADRAEEAEQLITSHRIESGTGVVVPLRREFEPLERRIAYRFRDRGLLEHALTHKSRAHEDASGGVTDNESLEFLGDAVLGFIVADMLFHEFPQYQEGQKSKVKAALVSTSTLATLGERLGLGEHILLGRGEEKTGGRRKQALLADTCEALIAALYLDGGIDEAQRFVLRELAEEIALVRSPQFLRDYKSALQERLQAEDRPLPDYVVTGTTGPDHDKSFQVEVRVGGELLAEAAGRTKKEAEQEAAHAALERLKTAESPRSSVLGHQGAKTDD